MFLVIIDNQRVRRQEDWNGGQGNVQENGQENRQENGQGNGQENGQEEGQEEGAPVTYR